MPHSPAAALPSRAVPCRTGLQPAPSAPPVRKGHRRSWGDPCCFRTGLPSLDTPRQNPPPAWLLGAGCPGGRGSSAEPPDVRPAGGGAAPRHVRGLPEPGEQRRGRNQPPNRRLWDEEARGGRRGRVLIEVERWSPPRLRRDDTQRLPGTALTL